MFQLLALVAAVVTAYLLYRAIKPLIDPVVVTDAVWQRLEDETSNLLHKRDRLVEELRDIEFEAALNKLDGADLKRLRERYEAEALDVMDQLDQQSDEYRDRIESDMASMRGKARKQAVEAVEPPAADETPATEPVVPTAQEEAPAVASVSAVPPAEAEAHQDCPSCNAPQPVDATFCDQCGQGLMAADHTCPACGTDNRPGARFCRRCGTSLEQEEVSA